MRLRVSLKISLRECFFLTLMRLYSYGYTRDTIFGRNFSTAVSTLLKESESVAPERVSVVPPAIEPDVGEIERSCGGVVTVALATAGA